MIVWSSSLFSSKKKKVIITILEFLPYSVFYYLYLIYVYVFFVLSLIEFFSVEDHFIMNFVVCEKSNCCNIPFYIILK